MPANKKLKSQSANISDKVRDYSNDPFVVKKADASKDFLDKHGFPKEWDSKSSTMD